MFGLWHHIEGFDAFEDEIFVHVGDIFGERLWVAAHIDDDRCLRLHELVHDS